MTVKCGKENKMHDPYASDKDCVSLLPTIKRG